MPLQVVVMALYILERCTPKRSSWLKGQRWLWGHCRNFAAKILWWSYNLSVSIRKAVWTEIRGEKWNHCLLFRMWGVPPSPKTSFWWVIHERNGPSNWWWENNWDVLRPFYKFPEEIRKIIYTTNVIEGLHRQYRKVTKSKTMFPSENALEKMLYLASKNVMKKWTQRYRNWDRVLSQLLILFPVRLESHL